MRVDILHVPGCPNVAMARSRVDEALRAAALEARVEQVEVTTHDDAQRLGMHGSPTILIDGRDPFPPDEDSSIACRLYRTPSGIEGSPAVDELVEALSR